MLVQLVAAAKINVVKMGKLTQASCLVVSMWLLLALEASEVVLCKLICLEQTN
jgi:hypothetical protein